MPYFKKETQKADFLQLEEKILQLWDSEKTFEHSVDQREGCDKFVFVEGPPTANGLPHPGHILTRVVKDLVLRYKTMQGFYVQRKAGWDTHGLPVEIEVEKELGINTKPEIERYGIENFNQKCKASVFKYEREWVNATKRVGFWIDMDDPYITFENDYIESVWWSLKEIWNKGLLYKGHKVVPFCPRCETTLSSHEVAQGYKDVEEPSVYVKFKARQEDKEESEPLYFLAWTTTPWTLLGNIALAVHPLLTYVKVRVKGHELTVNNGYKAQIPGLGRNKPVSQLSEKRISRAVRDHLYLIYGRANVKDVCCSPKLSNGIWQGTCKINGKQYNYQISPKDVLILSEERLNVLEGEYELLERFTGSDLEDLKYEPLFEYAKIEGGEAHKVITADFVTLDEGSGIVHIAPAFGEVDYEACKVRELGFTQPVDSEGRFTDEIPPLEGMFVKDADRLIIEMLDERGILYKEEPYVHSYPFCWRCGMPLLYYARESWFIAMSKLRDNLLANNEQISWYPDHLKYGRFGKFLENIADWALSRERFWGTPLPIWICTECGHQYCVGGVAELVKKANDSSSSKLGIQKLKDELDLHRPYIDDVVLKCDACGGDMRRVKDVIDCWYDSGSAPFAQWHYPFETERFTQNFPADFITEAIDQTRGWFYTLLGVSTAVFDAPPYLNVLSLGHILDDKGVKMSKSKGNVVDINKLFETEAADALRWYLYTVGPLTDDIRFSAPAIREKQKKFLNTLWNSYFFFVTYANIDEYNPDDKSIPVEQRNAMDRWIISRLNTLTKDVIAALERFEIHVASRKIEEFVVNDLSNWYIRRSRRRFWIVEENFDKDCAYLTLYEALVSLCKLLAPFVPFVTEHIYQNIARDVSESARESVHLCDFPSPDESLMDVELETSMELLSNLVEAGRRVRSDAGIKIRQPLQEVVITCSKEQREKGEELVEILKEEVNVKDVQFRDLSVDVMDVFAGDRGDYKMGVVDEEMRLFLDCNPSKTLIEEGLVRDIVRRTQGMRKDFDLEYTENISLGVRGDNEVIKAIHNFSDYIRNETLAVNIVVEGELLTSAKDEQIYEKPWKIGNKEVYLTIKRLSSVERDRNISNREK